MTNNETILVVGGNGKSTWGPALDGVTSAYVTYYPELAFPGASDAIREFARTALDHGVRRLVLLVRTRRAGRAALRGGADQLRRGPDVVRCAFFAQNFDEGFLAEAVRAGEFALPAGEVTEAIVDVDDIADVAVEALTGVGHVGQVYELSGPRLITFAEAAAELSRASGRDVRYVPITPDEFAALLAGAGLPDDYVSGLTGVFTEIMDGRNEYLADGVQRALGRAPRDFSDYARDTAATGVWA
jgi:uncharacterized protein YbjT (DUF2867 family)